DLAHATWNGSGAALHQRFVGLAHDVLIRRLISAWFKDVSPAAVWQFSMIDCHNTPGHSYVHIKPKVQRSRASSAGLLLRRRD
ncbi:MAG: hypothetical protein ACKVIS_18765, partial [Pseudomonadales bacterium]